MNLKETLTTKQSVADKQILNIWISLGKFFRDANAIIFEHVVLLNE